MFTLQNRLRPNEAEVAAKVLDGEAIIINLSNGIYYSMDKVGGLIWEMIERGRSLQEIVESIASARARLSSFSTSNPVCWCTTTSGSPPTRVATIGRAIRAACKATRPNAPRRDGITTTVEVFISSGTLSGATQPATWTNSLSPSSIACCSSAGCVAPSPSTAPSWDPPAPSRKESDKQEPLCTALQSEGPYNPVASPR